MRNVKVFTRIPEIQEWARKCVCSRSTGRAAGGHCGDAGLRSWALTSLVGRRVSSTAGPSQERSVGPLLCCQPLNPSFSYVPALSQGEAPPGLPLGMKRKQTAACAPWDGTHHSFSLCLFGEKLELFRFAERYPPKDIPLLCVQEAKENQFWSAYKSLPLGGSIVRLSFSQEK